jgi:hypothetical protein
MPFAIWNFGLDQNSDGKVNLNDAMEAQRMVAALVIPWEFIWKVIKVIILKASFQEIAFFHLNN